MAQTIPFSLLPLMISLCLCFSLLPNLIVAHQTNANGDDVFVTNLIEKACRHSHEKEVCIDALKLMPSGPRGTTGLTRLVERALKSARKIIMRTLDQLNDFIKKDTKGESYKQLLFNCTQSYYEAKTDLEFVLTYVNEDDFAMVAAKVNRANGMVKSCDQKIRNEPGHSQSLLINKTSKMFRRLSNFALVINRLTRTRACVGASPYLMGTFSCLGV